MNGGGIYQESDATVVIADNRIDHNDSSYGGGVAVVGEVGVGTGKVTLERNVITNNSGVQMGGGVFAQADHTRLYSNLIAANESRVGGGLYVSADPKGHPIFANNTFADNVGSEFYAFIYGQLDLSNNVFRTSRSDHVGTCQILRHGTANFSDNLVFSTNGATLVGECSIVGPLLNVDPQFVGGGSGTHAYALQPTSPAIDVGDNAAIEGHDRKDANGRPRIVGGTVDLGALEFRGD